MAHDIEVLAFDTFGTVTDWHTGVAGVLRRVFPEVDAAALAVEWRATYGPVLAEGESGRRPWMLLDDLHRETLQTLLRDAHATEPTDAQLDAAVAAWHTLPG